MPLNGAPADERCGHGCVASGAPELPFHTKGLLNPDGILGVVPGTWPLKIIYEQKILNGDNTGSDGACRHRNSATRFGRTTTPPIRSAPR